MPEGNGRPAPEFVRIARLDAPPLALAMTPQHFYRTAALPCPYLAGKTERKLVTELTGREARGFYDLLSRAGFRRSHNLAYRPACGGCSACVPVRILVEEFSDSRSLRRVRVVNRALRSNTAAALATLEQYRLFLRYQRSRHTDSDMAAMSYGDYRSMIEESPVATRLIEMRDPDGLLCGVCLLDVLDDGVSAVYSFYDPDRIKDSLGTLLILSLIDEARRRHLPYVYLGYWIAASAKMAYKARFRPLEGLDAGGWRRIVE